jgi:uncharacterized SAM-binding protein YcdF (DUF218 family)
MFLFRKIVGPFFFPLSLCLEILIIGLVLLWFTKKKRAGKIVVSSGVVLLLLFSYRPLPEMLLQPLEYSFPPLSEPRDIPQARWIVVLGAGHTYGPRLPANSQLSGAAVFRLVEGIRIHKSLPGSKLILSGGTLWGPVSEAKIMADVALALGVGRQNLILESVSKDTEDEAQLIQKIVGNNLFVLVSSASHMPRSMALFKKLGMQPIPAPTDYGVKEREGQEVVPYTFFPRVDELEKAQTAVYEYLGLAWAKLRGRI